MDSTLQHPTHASHESVTVIPNSILDDENLSWKAKGMLLWMLSRSSESDFNLPQMESVSPDGQTSVRSGLNELVAAGFVQRLTVRVGGKIVRHVVQVRDSLSVEFPPPPSAPTGDMA